jgi:hypothetical protein
MTLFPMSGQFWGCSGVFLYGLHSDVRIEPRERCRGEKNGDLRLDSVSGGFLCCDSKREAKNLCSSHEIFAKNSSFNFLGLFFVLFFSPVPYSRFIYLSGITRIEFFFAYIA